MKIDPSTPLSQKGLIFRPGYSYCSQSLPKLRTIWDFKEFDNFNGFISVGHVQNLNDFAVQRGIRILDCPIKFPGTEYRIPENILPWFPVIKTIANDNFSYSPNFDLEYCYITIDQSIVERNKTQRHGGAHVDGFQGERISPKLYVDHSYIVMDNTPTVFYNQPFKVDHLDPSKHNFFLEFDRQKEARYKISPQCGEIVKFNAYAVHEAAKTSETTTRTFFRMSYTVRQFDRLGNTHNPMFNYNWKMVERNIAENLR